MHGSRSPAFRRIVLAVAEALALASPAATNALEGVAWHSPSRLRARIAPEVRSSYVSLGKIVEDRMMQVTSVRLDYDTGVAGRFGVRNWDVSSLTERRADVHRLALYHWEWGPTWEYDLVFADGWKLTSDLTRSWTVYMGFVDPAGNTVSHWWQLDQSLENPYLVPFYRMRRCIRGSERFYFKTGLRRRQPLGAGFYATPSVFVEGGNGENFEKVLGANRVGDDWDSGGVCSLSFRLELGWSPNRNVTVFGFVEQYEIVGHDARDTNAQSAYLCTHNDWTHGGVGVRLAF